MDQVKDEPHSHSLDSVGHKTRGQYMMGQSFLANVWVRISTETIQGRMLNYLWQYLLY